MYIDKGGLIEDQDQGKGKYKDKGKWEGKGRNKDNDIDNHTFFCGEHLLSFQSYRYVRIQPNPH